MKKSYFIIICLLFLNSSVLPINYINLTKWTYLASLPFLYSYLSIKSALNITKKEKYSPTIQQKLNQDKIRKNQTPTNNNTRNDRVIPSMRLFLNAIYKESELICTLLASASTFHLAERILEKNPGSFFSITVMPIIGASIIYGTTRGLEYIIDDYYALEFSRKMEKTNSHLQENFEI